MRKLILGLSLTTAFLLADTAAENVEGEAVFKAKGCAACHKKDVDSIGPSLKRVGTAYAGKGSTLLTYLQGRGTPIVDPARASVMDPQLVKTAKLSEKDMSALAEYIISASDRAF